MEINIANPLLLLLISPVILLGFYAIRRGAPKLLIISRIIVLSLLIIALAGPYSLAVHTIRDEAPRITLISDQTLSMDLFEKGLGQKLYEYLKTRTPTNLRQIAGIRSPIGDEIIQSSQGNDNIVLVSDGNSNHGKDLRDAINMVSSYGTKVFAVRQRPVHNDLSVEIVGPKNIIIGNENVFSIIIRQAGEQASYKLEVQVDGKPEKTETITQKERTQVIPFSYTFSTLGTHKITAQITPTSEDRFSQNNLYRKAVYVVPKPKILLVTTETDSPLNTILTSLYQVTTTPDLGTDLSQYKAVIIDNKDAGSLSASTEELRKYLADGGGMAVFGGENAYDYGRYNTSPFEKLLPVISKAAEYRGGKNVILVIDASGSTFGDVIGEIDAIAISIVRNIETDSRLGVVAFGGKTEKIDIVAMSGANKKIVEEKIREIGPEGDNPTRMDEGLKEAQKILSAMPGTKEVIVISDGKIWDPRDASIQKLYGEITSAAQDVKEQGIAMQFIQVMSEDGIQPKYRELAEKVGGKFIPLKRGERPKPAEEEKPGVTPTPTPEKPEVTYQYSLSILDSNHFITRYLNITGDITGFNDVTPKLGSDRLIAISPGGKPILTVWNFGLGRVASLTTDDGYGEGKRWASVLYTGENSRLISSTVNWAIGDPRPKEALMIQSEDVWVGTSEKVTVTAEIPPRIILDGKSLDLTRAKGNTYEASILLEKEGFYDLSGYPIAANYPLEYREIGFNEKLLEIIAATEGKTYNQDEAESLLLLDIKEKSVRTVEEPKSEKMPFLLAALGLFLGEVILRRIKERYR